MARNWISQVPEVNIRSYTPLGNFIGESSIIDSDARYFLGLIREIPSNINTAEDERLSFNNTRYTKILIDDNKRIVIFNSVYKQGNKLYMRKICKFKYP